MATESRQLPGRQSVVVIGAGIVGNSVAYHLTQLGETDITLIDKGPLPNPGGSTGHASNFIFPVDHSKEMTSLTLESMRQYKDLDVFLECGGIEVARTEARMQELTRRIVSARTWGIEPVSLLTPAEIKELVPFINEEILLGGFYTPGAGVVDSLRAATIMRERAQQAGMTVAANTEVIGLDVEHGRVTRVRTDRGEIEVDRVVIACGCWSPRIASHGGGDHPADARRSPDDRHRPGAAVRRPQDAGRLPDRPRHGHQHVRAPGRDRARDRVLRPPPDHDRRRGDPLDRRVGAEPDRAALHAGGFRAADGAGARADARDRRRRDRRAALRDQRSAVGDV